MERELEDSMGNRFLSNAFALSMLQVDLAELTVRALSLDEARAETAGRQSAVGHADVAAVYSEQLGTTITANRSNIVLNKGDSLLVGQYVGPRLSEGATHLPDGATIRWQLVTVN
jgi:hypothetical protein